MSTARLRVGQVWSGEKERSGCRSLVSVTNESLALSLATHLFSPVTKASDNDDYYRLRRCCCREENDRGEGAVMMGQVTQLDDVAWELEGQFLIFLFRAKVCSTLMCRL